MGLQTVFSDMADSSTSGKHLPLKPKEVFNASSALFIALQESTKQFFMC